MDPKSGVPFGSDACIVRKKWTRFSAPNDALLQRKSIGWIPKWFPLFGSDALEACIDNRRAADEVRGFDVMTLRPLMMAEGEVPRAPNTATTM